MKKSTKAALLSALIFPGAGHISLKKYVPGFILIGVSATSVYYMFSKALERAIQITEQIQSGNIPLDVAGITEIASQQSSGSDAQLLNMATTALIICWLIGVIDSYRLGRVLNNKNEIRANR